MNNKIFITCAVTGSGDTAKKHPDLPKTPKQIANAAIEAAKAGAAIVHIHVREPDGKPSRRIELYDEVVSAMGINDYPEPDIKELGQDDVFSILLDPKRTFAIQKTSHLSKTLYSSRTFSNHIWLMSNEEFLYHLCPQV